VTPGLLAKWRLATRGAAAPRRTARGRDRRHAARSALAVGLIAVVAASLGLAVSVETVLPEWRDPEFGHRLRLLRDSDERSPGRPLVVVLGTSRTQNGLCPSAAGFADEPGSPRVFNFGQSASPPLKHYLTLCRLRDAGVRPAAVVVELLPASLMASGPAEEQLAVQAPRLSAADLDHLAPFAADAAALRSAWLRSRANPWYVQRQLLMNHWLPRWQPWPSRFEFQWTSLDADGFQPITEVGAESRARATAHARREYAGAFAHFAPAAASVRAVRHLVAQCREDGIPVAFAVPPVSPAFRSAYAPGVFSEGEAHLSALARRLDVPLFPAPRDMTEDDFLDGHHVYRHGAERYSRWLADNHLRPWLAAVGIGGVQ